MAKITCATCKWWMEIDGRVGKCRRYPPSPRPDAHYFDVNGIWPRTTSNDMCGEWTPEDKA